MSKDHRNGSDQRNEIRSASGGETRAPDAPVADFVSGNDPTHGVEWIRRSVRVSGVSSRDDLGEALNVILDLPGVARARRSDTGITIDMRPDVLSDQELQGALDRASLGMESWSDEPIPADRPD